MFDCRLCFFLYNQVADCPALSLLFIFDVKTIEAGLLLHLKNLFNGAETLINYNTEESQQEIIQFFKYFE